MKIASAAADVWMNPATSADLAFISRILVQAFLPHTDPKALGWTRRNGTFTLSVKSGIGADEHGVFKPYGVPYGTLPRLLMAWLNSEAIRNAQDAKNDNPKRIYLGRSLSEFLDKIGVDRSGGKKGGITRFKNQSERLFRAEITISCTGPNMMSERDMKISDGRFLFWNTSNPEQGSLWESSIELSDRFYALLVNNPVPLDWRILKSIKQSPMALDLYMWLTHRMSYLDKPVNIRWETLQQQLGADIEEPRKFRQQVRKHLIKIKAVWRELSVNADKPDVIRLEKSPSLLAKTKMGSPNSKPR